MATLIKKNVKGGYIYYVNFIYQGKRYRKSTTTSDRKLAKLILKDIELKIVENLSVSANLSQRSSGWPSSLTNILSFHWQPRRRILICLISIAVPFSCGLRAMFS